MTYVIQKGDTLYDIAYRFKTTVNHILSVNPQITNPYNLYPGS